MKRISRGAVALFITVAGALGTVTATAAPASAAPCQGSCWAGKDPNATICQNDAVTKASATYGTKRVELRYSPTCRAAWARIQSAYGDILVAHNSAGAKAYEINANSNFAWTSMLNDMNLTAWGCIEYSAGDVRACTSRY